MTEAAAVRERSITVVRAVPAWAWLGAIVVVSAGVRFAFARRIAAPWIMVDELIYSDLAKSFAETGRFLLRGDAANGYGVVYPALIAPAFKAFADVPTAYGAAKAINSLLFSLAAVPCYLLARRVVSLPYALLAAVLALAIPSGLYAGTLMTENAFYPLSLLVALALVLVLEQPTVARTLWLLAAIGLAFLTRAQAAAYVPAALAAPFLLGAGWRATLVRFRRFYGVVVGGALLAVLAQGARGQGPTELLGAYQAAGHSRYTFGGVAKWFAYHLVELDVYVCLLPAAALVVLLVHLRSLDSRARAFVAATASIAFWLVLEVATFASGNTFPQRIEERNMFYVAPLLLVAFVLWIERGMWRGRLAAVVAAGLAAVPVVLPYGDLIGDQARSDTLQVLAWWWLLDHGVAAGQVRWVIVAGAAAAAALFLVVPRRFALVLPAALLVYFGVTTAAIENGRNGLHRTSVGWLYGGIARPDRDWIDAAVGHDADVAALHVDARNADAPVIWLNEFFNRSVRDVYDVSIGPLPGGLPETRVHTDPDTGLLLDGTRELRHAYALAPVSYRLAARPVATDRRLGVVLYRARGPLRADHRVRGIYRDSWSGAKASYRIYDCKGGTLRAQVQQDKSLFPGPQTIRSGGKTFRVDSYAPVWIEVPLRSTAGRCDATFRISPTRVPGPHDPRRLGIHFAAFEYAR